MSKSYWNNYYNSYNKTNYTNYNNCSSQVQTKPVAQTKEVETEVTIVDNYTFLKNLLCRPKYTTLEFTPYAWAKINCYINLIGEKEITGFGKIEGEFITDIKIIRQSVRSAYVESSDDCSIAEFLSELPMEDIEKGLWSLDWHSHVNMQVFASGTDWGNYKQMLELRNGKTYPAMVINKKGDIWCKNILGDQKYTDITVYLPSEMIPENEFKKVYEECKNDILNKCKVISTIPINQDTKQNYTHNSNLEDEYYAVNGTYNIEDEINEMYENVYCKSCGTELLSPQELELGLCEDCSSSINQ